MKNLRDSLQDSLLKSDSDDEFISQVGALFQTRGVAVLQSFFKLMCEFDLAPALAEQHWDGVIQHRLKLQEQLGRPLPLISVLADYAAINNLVKASAKLVEISKFNSTTRASTHDSLTGLYNRQYFKHAIEHQFALAKRYEQDLSVLFIDGDDFKDINDQWGHQVGDMALQAIAKALRASVRESDIAARYGGEEFIVLMPQTNSLDALVLADRIRALIEEEGVLWQEEKIRLTVSGGIASYPLNAASAEDLIYFADSALYRAKGAGKNNISLFKQDKRRFLRINFKQSVKIKELGFSVSPTYSGFSKDICVGGILFENEKPIEIGTRIQVSVPIGEGDPLLLIGTVVRVEYVDDKRFDIGVVIAFKELDKLAKNEISRFLINQMGEMGSA